MLLQTIAKYPFLKETAIYIKEEDITLDDLFNEKIYLTAREIGKEIVKQALEREIIKRSFVKRTEQINEVLSYIISRILVSAINDSYLTSKYIVAMSKLFSRRLEKEDLEFILKVANDLEIKTNEELKIYFVDYLKNAPKDWKLVNEEIENGYIQITKEKLVRILEGRLANKFREELPLEVNEEIIKNFKEEIAEIKNLIIIKKGTYSPREFGKLNLEFLPPCMRQILGMIQNNENVPHQGRFAIVSFLHNIKVSNEEILKLFSMTPDFKEEKSRYQIEHITGKISGTEYKTPECSTMKSYGICYNEDELCKKEWLKHPLVYYRVKSKKEKKE